MPETTDRRILCIPTDRNDPAIGALPLDMQRIIERIEPHTGYTETTCDDCMRQVLIGPVQRAKAERLGDIKIVCYICVDPSTIGTYAGRPGH